MKWSFKIGEVKGIEIKVHLTFLIIVAWAAFYWGVALKGGVGGAIFGVILICLLFGCVVLHELSHSFQAIRYGYKVEDITLLPIGGMAKMESIPEDPAQELRMSIAGPMTNFAIALVLWILIKIFFAGQSTPGLYQVMTEISFRGLIHYLFVINIMLGAFNLIPAFPMDGGRVLRAILAKNMDYAKATTIAAMIGQGLAILMGMAGFFMGNFFLILIAIFIYMGAEQEGKVTEIKSVLRELIVEQVMTRDIKSVSSSTPLSEVIEIILHSYQEDFPVVDNDKLVGILPRSSIISTLHRSSADTPVKQAMKEDFPVVTLKTPLSEVYQKIMETRIKVIPVMEGDKFQGIINLEDISEAYMLLSAAGERRRSGLSKQQATKKE